MAPSLLHGSNDNYLYFPNARVTALSFGKFSNVYLGARQSNMQRVICKQLKPNLFTNKNARLRFLIEAGVSVNHSGIVRTIDLIKENNTLFIIQEYINGISLKHLIKTHRYNKKDWTIIAINIVIQVLDALSALHKLGYIHCDIKPANIMLINPHKLDKEKPKIKIIDFGLVRLLSEKGFYPENGKTTFNILYSAPELALNLHSISNERTDVYSCGLLLFVMLNGSPAFQATNPAQIIKGQISTLLPKSSYIPKSLHKVLRIATAKTLIHNSPSKFPHDILINILKDGMKLRYANCAVFKSELENIINFELIDKKN